jgi:hypothetical protein
MVGYRARVYEGTSFGNSRPFSEQNLHRNPLSEWEIAEPPRRSPIIAS